MILSSLRIGKKIKEDVMAAFIHYAWSDWAKVMLSDLSPANIVKWRDVANKKYDQLTESDKEFCRIWARQALDLREGKWEQSFNDRKD